MQFAPTKHPLQKKEKKDGRLIFLKIPCSKKEKKNGRLIF
jgi:hypothetical protein